MDLDSIYADLSRRVDRLEANRNPSYPSFLPAQQVCAICSSPTHFANSCPNLFPEDKYEHNYQDQTYMAYRPGNNLYYNTINTGWGAQPDFSWQSQSVITPAPQRPTFMDTPFYDYHPPLTSWTKILQREEYLILHQSSCLVLQVLSDNLILPLQQLQLMHPPPVQAGLRKYNLSKIS